MATTTKCVLVCFGERKRPVTLANDATVNDLKLAIVNEYQDVLPRSSLSTDQSVADRLVLQIKSEDWDGAFVDLKDEADVPDRSVLRVVEESQKDNVTDAAQVCSGFTKRTEKEKNVLAKLFSSSSSISRKRPMAFDPMAESSNSEFQRKKKCVVRPVSRDVIFFAEKCGRVPQRGLKVSLSKEGRMKSLVFKRTMTSLQVQEEIHRGFKSVCHDGPIHFLCAMKDNKLVESSIVQLGGDDICGKRGAVYVYQDPKPVKLSSSVEESSDTDLDELPNFPSNTPKIWKPKDDEIGVLENADSCRMKFVCSLSLKEGVLHEVERVNIYSSVMTLFTMNREVILQEYPLQIRFRGERAVDVGGVSRDFFSAFYDAVYAKYCDGVSLLYPVVNPHVKTSELKMLGLVISCGYLLSAVLPVRIAFPTLAAILLAKSHDLPDHVMVDSFAGILSAHDSAVIQSACRKVEFKEPFSESLETNLLTVFSCFDCRQAPSVGTFSHVVRDISNYLFLRKPCAFINDVRAGIPSVHQRFWKAMRCRDLYDLYRSMQASTAKVLSMLSELSPSTPKEGVVLSYLRQYIGNMRQEELQIFLRFVTGSSVCTANPLVVTFNNLEGLARRPVAHTCGYTLELSTSYASYSDFAQEFSSVLNTCQQDNLWNMDAV